MILFEGDTADSAWRQAARQMRDSSVFQESRDQPTRELLHTAFSISDPRQRVVFARPINPAFAVVEVIWIMAGGNSVDFLSFWNPRMKRFSDDGKTLRGAYGYRLGSSSAVDDTDYTFLGRVQFGEKPGLNQLKMAYEALRHTPYSRQVVLQIWDAAADLPNPEPRSRDVPCNIVSHLLIRDGRLEWLQVMRSNDLVWGTPYNFIQFTTMQEIIAGWLGIEVGTYTHISDSLHIYQRHWQALADYDIDDQFVPRNNADLRVTPFTEWKKLWSRMVEISLALSHYEKLEEIMSVVERAQNIPPAYREWVALLAAEALRRRAYHEEAEGMIKLAGPFWGSSWEKWANYAGKE